MKAKTQARVVTTDAEIDDAIELAKAYEKYRPKAVKATYRSRTDSIVIDFATGVILTIPRKLLQGLEKASPRDVAKVELEGYGSALHWEALDVDHYIPGLISGILGTREWMSELGKIGGTSRSDAKKAAARKNGSKGGRPRKPSAA
jgi:hypothetical protein